MRVLALDPSSRCTGYAVLDSLLPAGLIEGGLLKPGHGKRLADWLDEASVVDVAAWFGESEMAACRRVLETLWDVSELIERVEPDRVVIEVPSGKVGTGARRGASGSLTTYGMAAGAVWACCREKVSGGVVAVTERQWTAGAGSKADRQALVMSVYGARYAVGADGGGDTADAIGLGRWYLRRCTELGRLPA